MYDNNTSNKKFGPNGADDMPFKVISAPKSKFANSRGKFWSRLEDETLMRIVQEHGPQKWVMISKIMFDEIGVNIRPKVIRERWISHVDPSIKRESWTKEEDVKLLTACLTIGLRWKQISLQLPGRTEHAVKNRHQSLKTRGKHYFKHNQFTTQELLDLILTEEKENL
jgi:hypothetical protein